MGYPPGFPPPYITPQILTSAPTGISWNTIPPGSQVTPQQRLAEQWNLCQRATSQAEGYLNQSLRANLGTEYLQGPDYYATVQQYTGNIRLIMSRWPVVAVTGVQVSPNCFPRSWTTLTSGYWQPEVPVIGSYENSTPGGSAQGGQAVIISGLAGGGWYLGRNGFAFQVSYLSGFPHTMLSEAAEAGDEMLSVYDCTGWAVAAVDGAVGSLGGIYDAQQEAVMVTAASATAGPGTLTLSSPMVYDHAADVLISSMPQSVQWACVLIASAMALVRGATATTVHSVGGGATPASRGPESLTQEGELLLHSYRRII